MIKSDNKEQMTIVIVGHVDHGKSTVIGRLLADTGSLPEGKLESVKRTCERNSKPFEYAFLLDALKDEQSQGITIDAARIFFNTAKRHYLIFDAPGHIEFLKNMVTGAAHAQAALLVIDAFEGIKENSRRHGYLLSMLGVKQVSVLVNKMDLVNWDKSVYDSVVSEYSSFLKGLSVTPSSFIPISAFHGGNIASRAKETDWYKGPTVLEQLDTFTTPRPMEEMPLRFPVQDIYKFTEEGDDRRLIAGTIESGSVSAGDEVVFLPSGKRTSISSVEEFNKPKSSRASAGQAIGFTMATQIYIKPGEVMARSKDPQPLVSTRFKANIFWLGKRPLTKDKRYRFKLASARVPCKIEEIRTVIDASELSAVKGRQEVATNEVAEVIIETEKPVAFDVVGGADAMTRFVLVDDYDISGGGIITEPLLESNSSLNEYVAKREFAWVRSLVERSERALKIGQEPVFVLIAGASETGKIAVARELEAGLIRKGKHAYYMGISNLVSGLDSDIGPQYEDKGEHLRRLGELAHIMCDAGMIFIATASDVDEYDIKRLETLAKPGRLIVVSFGEENIGSYKSTLFIKVNPDIGEAARLIEKAIDGR